MKINKSLQKRFLDLKAEESKHQSAYEQIIQDIKDNKPVSKI